MIKQQLYSRNKVLEFKDYLVFWLLDLKPNQVSIKDRNELIDKYNEIFDLEVGE